MVETAEEVLSKTYTRFMRNWGSIQSLRQVAEIALPIARDQLAMQNESLVEFMSTHPANKAMKISFDHLAKPGIDPGDNPHHYVFVHVDGEKLSLEVVGVDWGVGFAPYRINTVDLEDKPSLSAP